MSSYINCIGKIVQKPVLRQTKTGIPVCNFTMACSREFGKNADGSSKTDLISCVAWRSAALFAARNLSKGQLIVADGSLDVRDVNDRYGVQRRIVQLNISRIHFVNGRPREQGVSRSVRVADAADHLRGPVTAGYADVSMSC